MPALISRIPGGKRSLIITAAVLVVALLFGVNLCRNRSEPPLAVEATPVKEEKLGEFVLATGKVELLSKQEVYAPLNRLVEKVPIRVGQKVEPGDLLVALEAGEEQMALLEAQGRLAQEEAEYARAFSPSEADLAIGQAEHEQARLSFENSRREMERGERLFLAGAMSPKDLEVTRQQLAAQEAAYLKAKKELELLRNGPQGADRQAASAKLANAREAVNLAQDTLARYIIPARIAGEVMAVRVVPGDVTTAGQHLVTLGDPNRLQVSVSVGEYDAARIKEGQPVTIEAAAFPERKHQGRVTEVARTAVEKQGSQSQQVEVPVKVLIDSKTRGLIPGFTVDLRITTVAEKLRLTVPHEAVVKRKGRDHVYLVKDGQARLTPVKTGIKGDLVMEILEGVKKGQQVILNPPEKLKDGQLVKPSTPGTNKENNHDSNQGLD